MKKEKVKHWYEVSFIRYGKKKCRHYRNVTTELLENMMKDNCHYIKVVEVEQVTKRISVTNI